MMISQVFFRCTGVQTIVASLGRDGGETRTRAQLKFASWHYVALLSNNKKQLAVGLDATAALFDDA